MNFLSLNIRGIGEDYKIAWVRRLTKKHRTMFLGVQETQLSDENHIDVAGCWYNGEFGFAATASAGRSGGLLSIWDSKIFQVEEVIKERYFLITIGKWSGIHGPFILANIYGPHDPQSKKKLWEDLGRIKATKGGTWVIFGDFNTVRKEGERFNSHFNRSEAFWFNRFIDKECLHEPRMGGHRFTYYCQSEFKMSKLDRFLVCNKFLTLFPSVSVTAAQWETSDHCPIILHTSISNFGKPPFRFFNSWMKRDGFEQIIKDSWERFNGYGNPDAYLAAKLRYLKNEIKKWRAKDHPKETEELMKLKHRVYELDIAAETTRLSEVELEERRIGVQRIAELEKLAVLDLKQKARIRWTIDGDENTRFFHGYVNNKKSKNHIHGLLINGSWSTNVAEIKDEVLSFYQRKFQEKWPCRPKLINSDFRKIESVTRSNIEAPFTMVEIKQAIWACGGDKAPGPDGFTFEFIKKYWDVLKGDIMEFVKYFEKHGTLARGCNSSFITLVPKIKDPLLIGDYRPISLIGSLYKIISKTLANRLSKIISKNIGDTQTAFVKGRNILDGPLIVNELCSWAKKVKKTDPPFQGRPGESI